MIYFLLIIIIFLLFVWDFIIFVHHMRVSNKLDNILKELRKEKQHERNI